MGVMLVTWKDIKELVTTFDFYIRLRVQATFNAPDIDEVIMTGASTIIPHDSLTEEILFTINDENGGVTVIGAPPGSGKSTYVKDAVMRARTMYPSLKIKLFGRGTSLLQLDELHNKFGIPPSRLMSTFLPKGTVIVIDQVDNTPSRLNELSREYIVHLATDSRNSKIYSIILCVSNPETFREILKLNGGDKIKPIFPYMGTMKWNNNQMEQFVSENLSHWTLTDRKLISDMCAPACSPGVFWSAIRVLKRYPSSSCVDEVIFDTIRLDVQKKVHIWRQFYEPECIVSTDNKTHSSTSEIDNKDV